MKKHLPPLILAAVALTACSSCSTKVETGSADQSRDTSPGEISPLPSQLAPGPIIPTEGPGGDMLPTVGPPTIADQNPGAAPSAPVTSRKEDLLAAAKSALTRNEMDEAVSYTDVLLIIYPGDPETLELRARVLLKQGDEAGAGRDLAQCCKSGRNTCCE